MTPQWRLQEAVTIAAKVESLRRTAIKLADSIQSVDLLEVPVVVDEIVAQLRPVDVGRMATELELATSNGLWRHVRRNGLTLDRRVTVRAQRSECCAALPLRLGDSRLVNLPVPTGNS